MCVLGLGDTWPPVSLRFAGSQVCTSFVRSLLWIDVEPVHDEQRRAGLGIGAEGPPEDLGDGVAVVDLRERPVHRQTKAVGPERHNDRIGYVADVLVEQL